MTFDPLYPTPRASQYRDGFLAGADKGGLVAIPAPLLSNAISRSVGEQWPADQAGAEFARCYFALKKRRNSASLKNFETYLLAWFESSLHSHKRD